MIRAFSMCLSAFTACGLLFAAPSPKPRPLRPPPQRHRATSRHLRRAPQAAQPGLWSRGCAVGPRTEATARAHWRRSGALSCKCDWKRPNVRRTRRPKRPKRRRLRRVVHVFEESCQDQKLACCAFWYLWPTARVLTLLARPLAYCSGVEGEQACGGGGGMQRCFERRQQRILLLVLIGGERIAAGAAVRGGACVGRANLSVRRGQGRGCGGGQGRGPPAARSPRGGARRKGQDRRRWWW